MSGQEIDKGGADRSERLLIRALEREYSRREFVRTLGAAGVLVGMPGLLAACSGDDEAAETTETSTGDIKRGGRLRVGHVGGGNAETLNPALGAAFIDVSRYHNIYDPLVRVLPDLEIGPALAVEWEANDDSTVWTLKLRPDVVWHDGSPFTANDVIYTLRSWGKESNATHSSSTNMRLDALKAVDDLTLEIPLKSPNARLVELFTGQNAVMIKDGATDFSNPVGTGPFKLQSFTVGERSLSVRNPNYWDEGKPYVDEWEDISIDDNAARLNALLDGEIDMMSSLEYAQAKAQQGSGQVQVIQAGGTFTHVIYMAVDVAPWNDPLVRKAFRLIPDRQALVDQALLGYGTVANDLGGKGQWNFASDLPPREQDLEQAKDLLQQAGREGLEVTLHTSNIVPGFVESATVFAEHAKGAGVTVNVKKEASNAYFDTSKLYTKLDFGQSWWGFSSIGNWHTQALLSDAVWNETHWRDPAFDKLIKEAQSATDESKAIDLWHEIQKIQYDDGGYIMWGNNDVLDAAANRVKGIVPSQWFNLGGWNYRDVWLDT